MRGMMNKEKLVRVGTEPYKNFRERIAITKGIRKQFKNAKIDYGNGIIIYQYEEKSC